MAELTPMMKQYREAKKAYPDTILFFRLGDFYEMFDGDALIASKELDLTLTSRDHGKKAKPAEEQIPMCGIPYHASDAYIAKLIAKGYKVAICEQMEDPATAKGLVKREILRVVTPGTVMDAAALDDRAGNFLCGLYLDSAENGSQSAGAAFCDLSTGEIHVTSFSGPDRAEHLINELGRFSPAEAVLSADALNCAALTEALQNKFHCHMEPGVKGNSVKDGTAESGAAGNRKTDGAAENGADFLFTVSLGKTARRVWTAKTPPRGLWARCCNISMIRRKSISPISTVWITMNRMCSWNWI